MPERQRAVSVDTAGEMTGLSPWTWRKMAYDGRVSSHKIGTRLLIPVSEVDRVLAESERPRLDPAAA